MEGRNPLRPQHRQTRLMVLRTQMHAVEYAQRTDMTVPFGGLRRTISPPSS